MKRRPTYKAMQVVSELPRKQVEEMLESALVEIVRLQFLVEKLGGNHGRESKRNRKTTKGSIH
jgi:hypothetical protein|tara:strand:- start:164 stop:352 length:189 start_codon:yes stop_codon:yes gene_type:complete